MTKKVHYYIPVVFKLNYKNNISNFYFHINQTRNF